MTTEGIVVRTIKYGETSLILDVYTKDRGMVSCIAGGVRKRKSQLHASVFQLLQPIKLTMYYKDGDRLSRIKEASPLTIVESLTRHPIKRVIVLFMAELLQKSIKEKEYNPGLYDFLFDALSNLNEIEDGIADFHLRFMVQLTAFLGFLPVHNYSLDLPLFDLEEGRFIGESRGVSTLGHEQSALLSTLLKSRQNKNHTLPWNNVKRRQLLDGLIQYYQYHVEGFGLMKSPEIIHVILS